MLHFSFGHAHWIVHASSGNGGALSRVALTNPGVARARARAPASTDVAIHGAILGGERSRSSRASLASCCCCGTGLRRREPKGNIPGASWTSRGGVGDLSWHPLGRHGGRQHPICGAASRDWERPIRDLLGCSRWRAHPVLGGGGCKEET